MTTRHSFLKSAAVGAPAEKRKRRSLPPFIERAVRVYLVRELNVAVIVAVVAIRVVQMTVHQIVDVIAVGNRLMAAVGTMLVLRAMCSAVMTAGAGGRIGRVHFKPVFVDMAGME